MALALQGLGANVAYYNRSKARPVLDDAGIPRLSLSDLMATCDILTLHIPRDTVVVDRDTLGLFKGGLVIHTSLGLPVDCGAIDWLTHEGHHLAADHDGLRTLPTSVRDLPGVSYYPYYSGFTREAVSRLVGGVVTNMAAHLQREAGAGAEGPYNLQCLRMDSTVVVLL
ncbi:hypothetical protein KIPB_009066 [Kipferlia bialata]|uniref:D-isomer specific 2-hydroxyacid dehydrogenase NAD-binding domain-containing protein n=1 Tax=Kipferlia bialata TaxID=797122 RepID=A0A9K3D323_9EUKA|nr:hypothetical protein KIPB_009066 [Kipferlia bialata]|eukprot:g9066.t1